MYWLFVIQGWDRVIYPSIDEALRLAMKGSRRVRETLVASRRIQAGAEDKYTAVFLVMSIAKCVGFEPCAAPRTTLVLDTRRIP